MSRLWIAALLVASSSHVARGDDATAAKAQALLKTYSFNADYTK